MENLCIVVPYWNGEATIQRLLDSLPDTLPVIITDDVSDEPFQTERENVRVIRLPEKRYFSGAVNVGVDAAQGDVLILNQDAYFANDAWMDVIAKNRQEFAIVGDGVFGHPAWPTGYIQGTFMFIRRDAWDKTGGFNEEDYPLWGATAEWQLRVCRQGFKVRPLRRIPGFMHRTNSRSGRKYRFGNAVGEAIKRWPGMRRKFLRTPPEISVIVPCYNYGHHLPDAINSLLGGPTCLGEWEPQTFQSFEIIIVDDASTDGSKEVVAGYHNPWKGIRVKLLDKNLGTPGALNAGITIALGRYIHILSADDMRESWALEKHYREVVANPRMAVYGDIQTFKQGERLKVLRLMEYDFDKMLTRNPMPAGITYPRDGWVEAGGYPERMVYGREDWAFNIALGNRGYCGKKLEGLSGNLCRRDGTNRSLRTKGAEWRERFLAQLATQFPELYEGERPVGCCGGSRRSRPSRAIPRTSPAASMRVGREGMKLLEFVGTSSGSATYWGAETGQRYVFGNNDRDRIKYVDIADVDGMLDIWKGHGPTFSIYVAPKKETIKVEALEVSRVQGGEIEHYLDATTGALKLAEIEGIDISLVEGSGKDGRIVKRDIEEFLRVPA
jgi:glycosyltransferase involved in cell wall biosynthesis